MALVTPALNTAILGLPRVVWAAVDAASTFDAWRMDAQYGLAGAVQVAGTFGGATISMQVSNDGTNWFPLLDLQGAAITATAGKLSEFTTSAAYVRPSISGGVGTALAIVMIPRGSSSAN